MRARIVRSPDATGTLPAILYMHGGGWVLGNAATHDRLVRELAVGTGAWRERRAPASGSMPVLWRITIIGELVNSSRNHSTNSPFANSPNAKIAVWVSP